MTRDFAESLEQIISDVVGKHPSDIDAAVEECDRRVKRLADYADFTDGLVKQALRHQICDFRHKANTAQKKAAGSYGTQARVSTGCSDAVADAAAEKSLYDYFIGGTVLGELTGEQLPEIADSEQTRADGHAFNAALCRDLAPLVAANKTVRQAVREGRLRTIWTAVQERIRNGRTAA